ncbi:MAG: hypothetical protein AAGI15_04695 [Pseudomonadota bacterium]
MLLQNTWQRLFLALIFLGLNGCSSMTPSECAQADWRAEGVRAAQANEPVTRFMTLQHACNPHGINPDRWAYVTGWESVYR